MDATVIQTRLGEAVRAARKVLGVSQEELAFRCGLHRTYIGSLERGERNVAIVNVVKIAKALRITAAGLLDHADL